MVVKDLLKVARVSQWSLRFFEWLLVGRLFWVVPLLSKKKVPI